MAYTTIRIALLAALAGLAGCEATLTTNANPAANRDADLWACQQEVAKMAGQAPARAPSYSTSCTTVGQTITCDSEPTRAGGMGIIPAMQAMPNCMRAKGWR